MKILFLGGLFMEPVESEIVKKSTAGIQYAANNFQWSIVKGLIKNDVTNVQVLSVPFISAYPNGFSDINIKEYDYPLYKGIEMKSLKFNNLWGLRNISRKNSLSREIKKHIKNKEKIVIMIYSLHSPLLLAAVEAKKQNTNVVICCIVPDLPQFMNLGKKKSVIFNFFKSIDIKTIKKSLDKVDCFVLLTDSMKDLLEVKNRPYVVIEGIVDGEKKTYYNLEQKKAQHNKEIVYTGTLNKKYGVLNLVQAFEKMDIKDATLKICGKGDMENEIKKYAENNKNIVYLGEINNEASVELQRNADVLVNPRQNIDEFTKYSFPSKNMEYLLSGTSTIAYKLDGIPDKYDDYIYYVQDNSIKSLAKSIQEVLSWTHEERVIFGENARNFVLNNKNNKIAVKKILQTIQRAL